MMLFIIKNNRRQKESWSFHIIVWCRIQQNNGGKINKDCNFVLTFSTRVRICNRLISSLTLNSGSPVFSLSISWAEWARAALDSMLGGYTENLKSKMNISCFILCKKWLNKNDKGSATNCQRQTSQSCRESHIEILVWRVNCAHHYLIWG